MSMKLGLCLSEANPHVVSIVTPDTWSSFSNYNILRAKAEMKASLSLREAAGHLICQVNIAINDLSVDIEAIFQRQALILNLSALLLSTLFASVYTK